MHPGYIMMTVAGKHAGMADTRQIIQQRVPPVGPMLPEVGMQSVETLSDPKDILTKSYGKEVIVNPKMYYDKIYEKFGGVDKVVADKKAMGIDMTIPASLYRNRKIYTKEDKSVMRNQDINYYNLLLDSPSVNVRTSPFVKGSGIYNEPDKYIGLNSDPAGHGNPMVVEPDPNNPLLVNPLTSINSLSHEMTHHIQTPVDSDSNYLKSDDSYYKNPSEIEAGLTGALHQYIQDTGQLVNTPDDIRKFMEYAKKDYFIQKLYKANALDDKLFFKIAPKLVQNDTGGNSANIG